MSFIADDTRKKINRITEIISKYLEKKGAIKMFLCFTIQDPDSDGELFACREGAKTQTDRILMRSMIATHMEKLSRKELNICEEQLKYLEEHPGDDHD